MIKNMIQSYVTGAVIDKISTKLGIPASTAKSVVSQALPLIMGGLGNSAGKGGDTAKGLFNAIAKHDGSAFNRLDAGDNSLMDEGQKVLGHLFGGKTMDISSMLGQKSGVDQGTANGVLQAMAPLVMGALGKEQTNQGMDMSKMIGMLNTKEENPATNMLNQFLDQDGDGSVVDDLFGMAKKFLS